MTCFIGCLWAFIFHDLQYRTLKMQLRHNPLSLMSADWMKWIVSCQFHEWWGFLRIHMLNNVFSVKLFLCTRAENNDWWYNLWSFINFCWSWCINVSNESFDFPKSPIFVVLGYGIERMYHRKSQTELIQLGSLQVYIFFKLALKSFLINFTVK